MVWLLFHGFTQGPEAWGALATHLPAEDAIFAPPLLGHAGVAFVRNFLVPMTAGARSTAYATFENVVLECAHDLTHMARSLAASERGFFDVVGYSLGARLALGLIVEHPVLFRSAVLIGVHPGLEDERERAARAQGDEHWASILEQKGLPTFVEAWSSQPIFSDQADLPDRVREAQRAQRLRHEPSALAHALRVLSLARMPNYGPRLSSITVPTCLVVGERDSKFRSLADRMGAEIAKSPAARRSKQVMIPGAGHNVLLEQPRSLAAVMSAFAAEIQSSTPQNGTGR